MPVALRRDLIAGGIAGLIGGLISGWAMQAQGLLASTAGLIGLATFGAGLAVHLVVSVIVGATFGAIFRHQPLGYAATITSGVLYALLWWIAGVLTAVPILRGQGPTWTAQAAAAALPNLVGHLVYGAIMGGSFYALVTAFERRWPSATDGELGARSPAVIRRIVILGGGFGGVSAAQRLEQLFSRDAGLEITLVSHSNYLLFTPMLAEVASSGLEAQHISAPVRAALFKTRFRRAAVEAVDVTSQTVTIKPSASTPPETLPYDHLVLAVGAIPNTFGLPGLDEHAFTLKTLQDATRLRNHVIAMLERADSEPDSSERRRQLTFVVAGGGFAGTEMIAELFDLVHGVLRYYPNVDPREPRFVLVHSGDRILPEISAALADYALRKLQARGIEFALKTRVAGAAADAVLLGEDRRIETRTLVWTAGNQPHPLLKMLPCERNRAGAVVAEATLQVSGVANVWGIGDCAQIPDMNARGGFCPPTAQHALRQGRTVADNIAAVMRGAPPLQFRFRTLGTLVALGHRTAVAEIRGLKFSGFLAWFMWRTVYLSKLPGLEKKVRVALDWTLDLFFPRDIVLTVGAPTPTLPQMIGAGPRAEASGAVRSGAGGLDE